MTYQVVYCCDYCHKSGPISWRSSIEEDWLSRDGKGGHICNACRLARLFAAPIRLEKGQEGGGE